MAHTEVFLSNDAGILVPSVPSVTVSEGDTVAFSVSGAGTVFAFFSPGAAAVLSPAPSGALALSSESPKVFTFVSSAAGSYTAFFETSACAEVPEFPGGKSNLLYMAIDSDSTGGTGPGFGGNVNHTRGG
jgi:hypothetical protein